MSSVEKKIRDTTDQLLKDNEELRQFVIDAGRTITFSGNDNSDKAINEYCLARFAEGVNEYLWSLNCNSSKQRKYEEYKELIGRLCSKYQISDSTRFVGLIDVPIIEDSAIAFVKALHPRKGKSKEELSEEFGISERMVRLNIRKLDSGQVSENGVNPGEYRIGGQLVRVPVSVRQDEKGKKYYYTPNTMQPIVMQLNVYQTAVILDSLMKEYYSESGVSIEIAASIWDQLSQYTKDRIRLVWGNHKEGFEDFLDEIEEYIENDYSKGFQTEEKIFTSDYSSIEDRLMAGVKGSKYLNILKNKEPKILKHVRVYEDHSNLGKPIYYACSEGVSPKEGIPFVFEDIEDISLCD